MAAVGTVTVTTSDLGNGVTKYSAAWVSDAAGVVSGTSFDVRRGRLLQAKFIPNTGGTVPTNLYDMTLTDADGADVLVGQWRQPLGDRRRLVFADQPDPIGGGALTPVIANAGNAKGGTLVVMVGP
jgi:hypothetical protein